MAELSIEEINRRARQFEVDSRKRREERLRPARERRARQKAEAEHNARLAQCAIEALRQHAEYEALPADRGGENGPKGKAWRIFIAMRNAAIGMAEKGAQ